MIRAGRLRTKVEVQERTLAVNTYGEDTETWTTVGYRWAGIRPLSTRELFAAQQTEAMATHEITMRYWDEITHEHRLMDGDKTYTIASVIDFRNRHSELRLLCNEDVS